MEPMVSKKKETIYAEFAKRLWEACEDYGFKRERGLSKKVGALAGIGYKGAEKWLNGLGMPDMGHGVALASNLGISYEWLMTGRGAKKIVGKAVNTNAVTIKSVASIQHVNEELMQRCIGIVERHFKQAKIPKTSSAWSARNIMKLAVFEYNRAMERGGLSDGEQEPRKQARM